MFLPQCNGAGHLWSIDLPPLDRDLRRQIGIALSKAAFEAALTDFFLSPRRRAQLCRYML
jgi:hypothetical protein